MVACCVFSCYDGIVSCVQEPRSLYNEVKTFPLSKLDRTANNTSIMKYIDDEVSK